MVARRLRVTGGTPPAPPATGGMFPRTTAVREFGGAREEGLGPLIVEH